MRRMLRPGVLAAVFACALALAGGAGLAAQPSQATFRVSLTATLSKEWTFTRTGSVGECTRTTRGTGRWEAKLSTRRASRVRAIRGSNGRVRFLGALVRAIAGAAKQTGLMRFVAQGRDPCERSVRNVRCAEKRRSFRNASTTFGSPRRGVVRFGALRGLAGARSFGGQCPEEPADIRDVRTDLRLADGPLAAADVFARDVPRFFVTGNSEQETTLEGDIDGRVVERVRWTLNFTRLPH